MNRIALYEEGKTLKKHLTAYIIATTSYIIEKETQNEQKKLKIITT